MAFMFLVGLFILGPFLVQLKIDIGLKPECEKSLSALWSKFTISHLTCEMNENTRHY